MSERGMRIRLWPGIVAAVTGWMLWLVVPEVAPEYKYVGILGGVGCGLLVLLWWLFFSRAPWGERLGGLALIVGALAATRLVLHPSMRGGMMGLLIVIYGIPVMAGALVLWAMSTRRLSDTTRWAALAGIVLVVCVGFAALRTDGITGEGESQFTWRWTPSAEQELLAVAPPAPVAPVQPAVAAAPPTRVTPSVEVETSPPPMPDWPGFRGTQRDSTVSGLRIRTDWETSRPAELWKRPVGPGWSSFAVANGVLYTQEQRGESELVSAYNARTGEPVWTHKDQARFYESNGGPGPRGTPLLHRGRVYALGATGILNALDAKSGAVVWTRNAEKDTGAKIPGWGYTSSPLVWEDTLLVAVSGVLAAYDLESGNPKWVAEKAGGSYSSPHLITFDGVPQVVLMSSVGATSLSPKDGSVLWKHAWAGYPILQPATTADGDLLVATSDTGGLGTRRLKVARGTDGWKAEEVWTSRGLKPYFNDFVVHKGHAYGFDGSMLSCIDLKDGERKWKGGRYGHGQMLLLRDQDLLLVLSEDGEVAMVAAAPDGYREVARTKAIEGKTWNHPVVVGDTLFVRNGEQMAALRLPR